MVGRSCPGFGQVDELSLIAGTVGGEDQASRHDSRRVFAVVDAYELECEVERCGGTRSRVDRIILHVQHVTA